MKRFLFFSTAYFASCTLAWFYFTYWEKPVLHTPLGDAAGLVVFYIMGPLNGLAILEYFPWEFIVESVAILGLLFLECIWPQRIFRVLLGTVWLLSGLQNALYLMNI